MEAEAEIVVKVDTGVEVLEEVNTEAEADVKVVDAQVEVKAS